MKNNKKAYISLLNVIAAFAVVMLHTNGCFWNFSRDSYWISANMIESIMYFAVPVFFMITGATLMDFNERYNIKEYFVKRIRKALIPFLAWSIIGLLYMVLTGGIKIEQFTIAYLIDSIFNTSIIGIYWFFIPLFAVYLSIPVFAAVPKSNRKKIFSYLILIAFIFNFFVPFLVKIFPVGIRYNNNMNIPVVQGYLIYVLMGYILDTYEIEKKWRYCIYILAVIGLTLHIGGTYYLSMAADEIIQTYKGYLNLPCLLYSVGVFLFVKEISEKVLKNGHVMKMVNIYANHTFSIYLMHWFVMSICNKLIPMNRFSLIYRLFFPFFIVGVCMVLSSIIKKIPLLRKILP